MNWKSRFLIKAVGAMVLVGFGGGFVPTASACEATPVRCTRSPPQAEIYNNDLKNKIAVQACTQPTNARTSGESGCVGSKFNETIAPSGSWSGPAPAKDMKLIVLTAKIVPSAPAFNPTSLGCTSTQLNSPAVKPCMDRGTQDIGAGYTNIHVVRCHGDSMECCIGTKEGNFNDCRPIVAYTRPSNVPKVDVVCETLKSEKGVWTPDLKSIKQDADKKHCTEAFTCEPPPANKLSADERKCTAVISVNKTTTLQGVCVDDKCGSCNVGTPNTPCDVSFRGSKP